MKLTIKKIRKIIREEIRSNILESRPDPSNKPGYEEIEEIGYDPEDVRKRAELEINWLPEFVGEIEIDMPSSKIPIVKKSIIDALAVLKDKAPEEYNFVQKYLKKITSGHTSGIDIKNRKFSIADISLLNQSPEWLASIIYHDARHVWQMENEEGRAKDRETPVNLKQLDLLKKLNASPSEINHLIDIIKKGDHSDRDGDGDYDIEDWKLRKGQW